MMENEHRPDPDALLDIIKAQESTSKRGKLRIFFGACAGVGKTYAMLSTARALFQEGVDVVIGLVETHGREETIKMLEGLPVLPKKQIDHRGIMLEEFDIDAAIDRKPGLLLIDELAHTNAPGCRHPKRWQDVKELLDEGIDIYTTLNVQHLESLNDVVAKITGVWVKETVPDSIFDNADDITLIDIPADELLKRLKAGKVYIVDQVKKRAAQNFFKKSNLIALREIALRRTAERVDAQMDTYNAEQGVRENTAVLDKIAVCIGPDALSVKLVRAAKRMAIGLKASWVTLYVENHRHYKLNEKGRQAVERTLRLAQDMGAKIERLYGDNATESIIEYARAHGITKIIAGKSNKSRWKEIVYGSLVDHLIRKSGDIDIYVITGDSPQDNELREKQNIERTFDFKGYAISLITIIICTLFAIFTKEYLNNSNTLVIFLLGVIAASSTGSRGASLFASIISILSFVFFCSKPEYGIQLSDVEYIISTVVFIVVSLSINALAFKLRMQAEFFKQRENEITALYAMTRELSSVRGHNSMAEVATRNIGELFKCSVAIWIPNKLGYLDIISPYEGEKESKEESVARWAFDYQQPAGIGTSTLPSSKGLYIPLMVDDNAIGVLSLIPFDEEKKFTTEEMSLLETFCGLITSSFERATSAEVAENSRIAAESAKLLRNILLGSGAE